MSKVKYKSSYHKWRLENGFSVISNNKLELFFLDEISTDIYSIIKNNAKSINEIVDIMINDFSYGVDKDNLQHDIEGLFECFLKYELLEVI